MEKYFTRYLNRFSYLHGQVFTKEALGYLNGLDRYLHRKHNMSRASKACKKHNVYQKFDDEIT